MAAEHSEPVRPTGQPVSFAAAIENWSAFDLPWSVIQSRRSPGRCASVFRMLKKRNHANERMRGRLLSLIYTNTKTLRSGERDIHKVIIMPSSEDATFVTFVSRDLEFLETS